MFSTKESKVKRWLSSGNPLVGALFDYAGLTRSSSVLWTSIIVPQRNYFCLGSFRHHRDSCFSQPPSALWKPRCCGWRRMTDSQRVWHRRSNWECSVPVKRGGREPRPLEPTCLTAPFRSQVCNGVIAASR